LPFGVAYLRFVQVGEVCSKTARHMDMLRCSSLTGMHALASLERISRVFIGLNCIKVVFLDSCNCAQVPSILCYIAMQHSVMLRCTTCKDKGVSMRAVEMQPVSDVQAPFTLAGKVALVTGAARGIGKAIAQRLAMAGASVMINDLDVDALTSAKAEIPAGRVQYMHGDLTDPSVPDMLVQNTIDRFGAIDIIVNNAGYTWDSVIQKTTDEQFQAMLDIHIVTPFRILRAASSFIREAAKRETEAGQRVMRKVVNITSISATDGNPGQAGYSSGKAGVIGLTRTMAKEWGRYNVNVNAVGFGLIETRLVQPLNGDSVKMRGKQIRLGVQPSLLDSAKSTCPLGRLGTPEDAAGAVLFFASPLSDYVTGEVLICSGGLHF
jgi:3-oxoacyl-[acyl-carrier protein] reductase